MATNWVIDSQRQTSELSPAGRFNEVMEITFTTATGTHGQVRVPLNLYNAEHVREVIDQRVAHMMEVENL
jgi:hypothetical protein